MEVEAKVALRDATALRRVLENLGARPEPPRDQTDLFFAHPCRDLAAADECLRLRAEGGFLELTYKGPRQGDGDLKERVELEVPVASDPTPLLEALGFRRAAVLRKSRASTRVGDCRVDLDHVEGLGDFLEVEGLHEDPARAASAVHSVLVRLSLDQAPRIQESYLELALRADADAVRRLDAGDGPDT